MRVIPFALTIFLSAFLLFQVQPLIARYILPWFGGSAGVWSVTMLFFQCVLLLGYGYAHLLNSRLNPRSQLVVHLAVLVLGAAVLPVIPRDSLQPEPGAEPIGSILLLLIGTVGIPYFALSATGPLLQAWFSRAVPGRSPWSLYALSNAGSLLALVSFPFVFEPVLTRVELAWAWSIGFWMFAALCAAVAFMQLVPSAAATRTEPLEAPSAPTRAVRAAWLLLSAAGSALLLSLTNELCLDVASVPLLWVLPLALYLLSFIATFTSGRGIPARVYRPLGLAGAAGVALLSLVHLNLSLPWLVVSYGAALLAMTVACHGEAYRLRPHAAHLTAFYLVISAGGALGGLFVAVVSPLVLPMRVELPIVVLATMALLLALMSRDEKSRLGQGRPRWAWFGLTLVTIGAAALFCVQTVFALRDVIVVRRDFYGVFRVTETPDEPGVIWSRSLASGTTRHGLQLMDPPLRGVPTTYYGRQSGAGLTIEGLYPRGPLRVGGLGLGVGTLAAYGRPEDTYRFYELVPGVIEIANRDFHYLRQCPARCEVVVGDGRMVMAAEADQQFDVLALDAFSSDSVPVHLLTREAFAVYLRHLDTDGVLCINISNRHLDLRPVVQAGAEHLGMTYICWVSNPNERTATTEAVWFLASPSPRFRAEFEASARRLLAQYQADGMMASMPAGLGAAAPAVDTTGLRPWTDDYSNLLQVLR